MTYISHRSITHRVKCYEEKKNDFQPECKLLNCRVSVVYHARFINVKKNNNKRFSGFKIVLSLICSFHATLASHSTFHTIDKKRIYEYIFIRIIRLALFLIRTNPTFDKCSKRSKISHYLFITWYLFWNFVSTNSIQLSTPIVFLFARVRE